MGRCGTDAQDDRARRVPQPHRPRHLDIRGQVHELPRHGQQPFAHHAFQVVRGGAVVRRRPRHRAGSMPHRPREREPASGPLPRRREPALRNPSDPYRRWAASEVPSPTRRDSWASPAFRQASIAPVIRARPIPRPRYGLHPDLCAPGERTRSGASQERLRQQGPVEEGSADEGPPPRPSGGGPGRAQVAPAQRRFLFAVGGFPHASRRPPDPERIT